MALIYALFPLYFSEVFPIAQGQISSINLGYSLMQIRKLTIYYGYIIVFVVVGILINMYAIVKEKCIVGKVSYELFQIACTLLPLIYIAKNQGTIYTYYLQLWYPYIILYGVISIPVIAKHIESIQKENMNIAYSVLTCILIALSVKNVMFSDVLISSGISSDMIPSCQCTFMNEEQKEAWNRIYHILEQYSDKGEILVSMHLSEYCLENNIAASNYGQAEFNTIENLQNYQNSKLWKNIFLFDYAGDLLQQNILYNETVKNNIYNHKYSCIASVYAKEYGLSEDDFVNAGYHMMTSEELMTGSQCWNTAVYVIDSE